MIEKKGEAEDTFRKQALGTLVESVYPRERVHIIFTAEEIILSRSVTWFLK